jgi:hypothetical protein
LKLEKERIMDSNLADVVVHTDDSLNEIGSETIAKICREERRSERG